jgi:hypothetical protein
MGAIGRLDSYHVAVRLELGDFDLSKMVRGVRIGPAR